MFSPLTPTIYRYKEVFRKLGLEVNLENHIYPLKPNFPSNVQFINKKYQKKLIGIAPFSAHKGKTYPLDLMQKVIAFLQREFIVILFGGGKNETQQIKIWERAYKNVKFFSDKISFNDELKFSYIFKVSAIAFKINTVTVNLISLFFSFLFKVLRIPMT